MSNKFVIMALEILASSGGVPVANKTGTPEWAAFVLAEVYLEEAYRMTNEARDKERNRCVKEIRKFADGDFLSMRDQLNFIAGEIETPTLKRKVD